MTTYEFEKAAKRAVCAVIKENHGEDFRIEDISVVCDLCANHEKCMESPPLVRMCAFVKPAFKNFELRMEGD